jgi:hypothetical protein
VNPNEDQTRYFELTLHKPWLGWFPKPTVVVNGQGQPAQWGYRKWKVPGDGSAAVKVFLFNRLWTYGTAEFSVELSAESASPNVFVYSAPWLPFLPGRISPA